MAKWKCPEDAGPGVSIGGQWFENVDGVITTPDDPQYALALSPHGYVHMPPSKEELEAAQKALEEEAAAVAAAEAEAAAQREAEEAAAKEAEEAAAKEAEEAAAKEAEEAAAKEAEAAKGGKAKK